MNSFLVLLKKDFKEKISGYKQKGKDVKGLILNVFLTLFVVGVFVFAFSYFTQTYANIKIGYLTNIKERSYEIITIFYAFLIILLTIVGVVKLNKNLIDVGSLTLLSLPITPFQIFMSKTIIVYLELTLTSLLFSLSIFLLLTVQGLVAWWLILVSLFLALLLPLISLGLASIFTIPYYYIKKWLNKHFIIQLIVYVAFIALAFVVYSVFLRFIKGLMESGQITFFFNETNVLKIGKLCKYLIPAKFFSSLMLGNNVLFSLLLLITSLVVSGLVGFYICKLVFALVRQNKLGRSNDFVKNVENKEQKPVTYSLIKKEFTNVLRTPSLAFNYFAIVLTLPLMVLITSGLLSSMMNELTFLNCDFEIVLCSLTMYSILLNSFCANNISREGKFFNFTKTLPLTPKKVVLSKILFCLITSVCSIIITGILVLIMGLISPLKAVACIIICSALNFGVICLATRKDLNTTSSKVKEENTNSTNFLIFWGLILSVILTVVSFVLSLYFQTRFSLTVASWITCLILLLISAFVCGVSLIYLLKNLNKKYKEVIL